MSGKTGNPWLSLYLLGLESSQVMTLRALKLAAGGHAARMEATRMTAEKVSEAYGAWVTLASGGSAPKVVRQYRKRVGANARRLKRKAR
jgi:hypothetical protein